MIFAGAMLVMTLMVAVVIDISWLWSSALKIQRAADAAALAGAATLPNNPNRGMRLADEEAIKNGYRGTDPGVDVTPSYDPAANPYRMNVTIKAPVGMFFLRVVGLGSFDVTRTAHAELNLPLKMGSPEQWYGVGTFEKLDPVQGPPVREDADTDWRSPGTTPSGAWTTPDLADDENDNRFAVSHVLSGSEQTWGGFGLTSSGPNAIPDDPSLVIEGIEVRFRALITGTGGSTTGCRLLTDISRDGGTSWTTPQVDQDLTTTEPPLPYTLGSDSSLVDWPRPGGWNDASFFNNTNFRVRLTWDKPSCGSNRTASVDTLEVRVTYHSQVPGPITYVPVTVPVPIPPGETVQPTSQGFWGAVFTAGSARRNGDRYAPRWVFGGSSQTNAEHIDTGYDYTVEIRGSNGRVHLFDPVFCATGDNPAGSGHYGAGDHWTEIPDSGVDVPNGPVTTEFTLWDTKGTVINKADDTEVASKSFTSRASDQSGMFDDPDDGGPGAGDIPTGGVVGDCRDLQYHNDWYTLASSLGSGTYRVNVKTSQPGNAGTAAENMWSIYVGANGAAGSARVYGEARMVGYSNLTGDEALQAFYLTQIERVHAGKTMEIRLFDPGDVAGNATLRIKSPDGNAYNDATFSYQADGECDAGVSDACSGSGRTSIRTAVVGGYSSFDNSVITITIALPTTYGQGGLRPDGETEDGWWKIEYQVGAANDTTTWEVSILENPVHLVVE